MGRHGRRTDMDLATEAVQRALANLEGVRASGAQASALGAVLADLDVAEDCLRRVALRDRHSPVESRVDKRAGRGTLATMIV